MCDPLTIGSLALTAGGAVANSIAQSKVEKARRGAIEAENIRQRKLRQEADAINAGAAERYDEFGADQENRAAKLAEFFSGESREQAKPLAPPGSQLPTTASNITLSEQRKQRAETAARDTAAADALANFRSFGDLLGEISRMQGRDASQINTLGGFMRGSQNVLPLELEAANNKGAGWRTFGDLLNAGGMVTGVMSGAGVFSDANKAINWAPSGMTVKDATAAGMKLRPGPVNPGPLWNGIDKVRNFLTYGAR